MSKKGGLGMGLDAIFDDNTLKEKDNITTVRVTDIEPNKNQPRKKFDEKEISKLAESINEHGLIQPIIVRPIADERYQIVAGERRWKACKMAGINEIPIIIRDLTDIETAEIALIENLQRAELNPIEEAAAYKQLMEEYGVTQDALSKMVGRSRSFIANSVRLLSLPEEVRDMLENNEITVGHAKALAAIEDEEYMLETARKAAKGLLTVRNIENLSSELQKENKDIPSSEKEKSGEKKKLLKLYTEIELSLSEKLGRRIKINAGKDGGGSISIDFFDKEDLNELAEHIALF